MTFLGLVTVWALSICPTSDLDASEWSFPSPKNVCVDKDRSGCADAIEEEMIRRHSAVVDRAPGVLHFHMPTGGDFALPDTIDGEHRSHRYFFYGSSGEFHLIRVLSYESAWFGLLHRATGRFTEFYRGGLPVISPGRDLAASASSQIGNREALVEVWVANGDGLARSAEFLLRTTSFGTPLVHWMSADRLAVCWKSKDDIVEVGHLYLDTDGWHLDHTQAAE